MQEPGRAVEPMQAPPMRVAIRAPAAPVAAALAAAAALTAAPVAAALAAAAALTAAPVAAALTAGPRAVADQVEPATAGPVDRPHRIATDSCLRLPGRPRSSVGRTAT